MFHRIHNLLLSSVTFIRARRTDKTVTAQLSDCLSADVVDLADSTFDIGRILGCHTGTFNAVLLRLLDWATTDPTPVLWLTGPAGTSKSVVARSLIAQWKSAHRLAASFYCNGNRNSINSLIPALAHQIAQAIPELHLHGVSDSPKSSKQSSFQSQFEKFISNPILQLNLPPARRRATFPILIVVDGLDECDQKERSLFLKTLLEAAPRLRRYLKFLIVSRPESDIQNFFESTSIQDEINIIDLSTYRTHSVGNDIIPKTTCGPARPLRNSIHDIDVLFHSIISSSSTSQTTLVRLLSVVFVCLQTDESPLKPFNNIPVSLTQSDRFVESILDLEPGSLQTALSDLKSLLSFRRRMAIDGRPFRDVRIIKFVHGSLKDFLLDHSRSGEFHVDLKSACLTVAKGILRVLADNGRTEQRYWNPEVSEQCDPRPAYHNCLVWCYERLTPDGDLQRAMMEYDPIDYLLLRRRSIPYPTAVAFFTFACKSLRRFEDLPTFDNISNHLRSHLDRYLNSELDHWVPHNSDLMRVLKASIFPDHIDWETFRSSEEMLECEHDAISKRLDDPRVVEEHLPYFLTWMFDKGLGYAGGTVERTVCNYFYSENRAGKYYFGSVAGV